ncbi:PREDICTED: tether containing UBX domain for GLUT4 [Dipodomys ordii]|uniref:Tether containing UBX domain for GLUT4 n=1 Tax=Dipodomys ordii TaxID=10020 RepID=A0A1S3GIB8_DIPOR|nr:PREDICTED: tether containing UBX domain for GLUT4 [Dipodomys ordii]
MVPASRSREGPENRVRIALQLDDGSRLQDTFFSGQTLWDLLSHFTQTRECLQQPGEATPMCVYMRDEVTGGAALQSTTLQSLGLTGGGATLRFVMKQCDSTSKQEAGPSRSKTPGSPTCSVSADQASSSPLLPLSSGELSKGDLSHQGDTGTAGTGPLGGPKPVDAQAKQSAREPIPVPFTPFSGGGQRLGGPSGPSRPLVSPSAKSPKTFSSPGGPSKPKKSKAGEELQQDPEMVRDGLGGGPCVAPETLASRVLTGISSHLFIAPPKTILDDHTLTLFQANLFPAALVHFGAEEPTAFYLEPGLLEHTVPPSAADVLVARYMPRASGTPPPLPAPEPAPLESEPPAEEGALPPPEPTPGTAQPVRRSLGKVPKWLKLPASKR